MLAFCPAGRDDRSRRTRENSRWAFQQRLEESQEASAVSGRGIAQADRPKPPLNCARSGPSASGCRFRAAAGPVHVQRHRSSSGLRPGRLAGGDVRGRTGRRGLRPRVKPGVRHSSRYRADPGRREAGITRSDRKPGDHRFPTGSARQAPDDPSLRPLETNVPALSDSTAPYARTLSTGPKMALVYRRTGHLRAAQLCSATPNSRARCAIAIRSTRLAIRKVDI